MEKCCHQNVQNQTLQLYYTQNQRRLHLILKWTRIFSHGDRSWWLITYSQVWILAPSCQGGHHKIRPKGHTPTKTRGFPFQICENPDLISQNWPHRDLKRASNYKTLKNQAHRRKHAHPRAAISFGNRSLVFQICANLPTISEKRPYQEILRPPI